MGDDIYVFDIGEGFQRQLKAAGLSPSNVRAIFLSHHHIDHVGGLMPFIVSRWAIGIHKNIPVIGPPGTNAMVDGILAGSVPIEQAPLAAGNGPGRTIASTVTRSELPAGPSAPVEIYADENIRVTTIGVDHFHDTDGKLSSTVFSYAFRAQIGTHSVVYSGDTGPSANLATLAKGSDLLVSEVMDRGATKQALEHMPLPAAYREGLMRHMDIEHMTPQHVARIARAAGVKQLVLTHLVPGRDDEQGGQGYIDDIQTNYRGPVVVARDGQRFAIPAD
ncbi:MBL fold metallo-hydrolase [Sphingomonas sp. Root710]|uniref:MBL fold metallo-hydrolase n=1 Tax=Sphingomonas sp. Root710 TaxID=1736594 RepID=UPI00138F69D9|nr:MBL fold metallo-hydrolase [Sphingomonas sp. Root710]